VGGGTRKSFGKGQKTRSKLLRYRAKRYFAAGDDGREDYDKEANQDVTSTREPSGPGIRAKDGR